MDSNLRCRLGGVYLTRLSAFAGELRHVKSTIERDFLESVERGDLASVTRLLLADNGELDINCTDILGRTALIIAVDNENVEIVQVLLQNDTVITGSALIHAIVEGSYKIVELIVQHPSIQREMLSRPLEPGLTGGTLPGVSPIMMAAQCNQFEILQLFLSYGAFITHPHVFTCKCGACTGAVASDCLGHSLKRIQTYRALTSAAWISLTSEDPILEAFKLSWELSELSSVENEFQQTFVQLSDQCKRYACDLLDQCRTSDEVLAVLNRTTPGEDATAAMTGRQERAKHVQVTRSENPASLRRLSLAIKYKQKQFVAHPHSQHMLMNVWYAGMPFWRGHSQLSKIAICTVIVLCLPVIAVVYLLLPRSRLGRAVKTPFMKFIYHSASFCFFLLLLLASSLRSYDDARRAQNVRGPSPSNVEWLVAIWVIGMVWGECKQLWDEGFREYVLQWWNWLDYVMLSIYISSFLLKAVAYLQIQSGAYGCRELDRMKWPSTDPTLISEGLFSVASVFSFARIIYLFQTNPHLGPLQISLGCMIIDIIKFLFIFFLILTSFACGLNQLFWYYRSEDSNDLFSTIASSYTTLLWSLFGQIPVRTLAAQRHQQVTHLLGQVLLAAYLIMAVTVMVNMLIAMMSRSFQIVEDHADREWKFARSKLWMSYFEEGSTLPSPFNVIISPKWLGYTVSGVRHVCLVLVESVRFLLDLLRQRIPTPETVVTVLNTEPSCATTGGLKQESVRSRYSTSESTTPRRLEIEQPVPFDDDSTHEEHPTYSDIIRLLVARYIMNFKSQHRRSGANEDDFMEIKQDISSLRYELREDRKREASRNFRNMDGIRSDILGVLRGQPGVTTASTKQHCKCTDCNRMSRISSFYAQNPHQHLSLDLGQLSRSHADSVNLCACHKSDAAADLSVQEQNVLRRLIRREVQNETAKHFLYRETIRTDTSNHRTEHAHFPGRETSDNDQFAGGGAPDHADSLCCTSTTNHVQSSCCTSKNHAHKSCCTTTNHAYPSCCTTSDHAHKSCCTTSDHAHPPSCSSTDLIQHTSSHHDRNTLRQMSAVNYRTSVEHNPVIQVLQNPSGNCSENSHLQTSGGASLPESMGSCVQLGTRFTGVNDSVSSSTERRAEHPRNTGVGTRERRRAICAGQSLDCLTHYFDSPNDKTLQPTQL